MRRPLVAGLALPLLLAACSAPSPPGSASTPAPSASASGEAASGPPALTQQACQVLTAADVQSALGVQVSQLPMTEPPPGGGPGGSLVSGCTYSSATGAVAGASLYLFKDMPIDYFATVPGFEKVPGVGDTAFLQGPMLVGRKGSTTFQLTIVSDADQATRARTLTALGTSVARRL